MRTNLLQEQAESYEKLARTLRDYGLEIYAIEAEDKAASLKVAAKVLNESPGVSAARIADEVL